MPYFSAVRKVKKEIWQVPLICFIMVFFFLSNRGRTDIESLEKNIFNKNLRHEIQ